MATRLNLEEIGKLAGVSRSTVSRVINGESNVSPEARARVEAVIAETGYRPHAAARSLASNRTGVVGLVIPSAVATLFDDPYFGRLILGVSNATQLAGTTLSLFLFREESEESAIGSRVIGPGLVDGLIVTATRMGDPLIDELVDVGMPFVIVGRPDDGRPVFSVDADNRGGARCAALHLASHGYRRVGMISPPSNTTAGVDRRAGFLEGAADADLDVSGLLHEGDWSEASAHAAMAQMLESSSVEAVFVGSDRMAVGALRAIREAGLRCPEDVAVISFDGLLPPSQTMPRLTSVAQPVTDVGERAAALLNAVIEGELTTPEQIVLPTELVIRESCGTTEGNSS
ncbi:MAG: LacI family DNA-binding transcriptional regulator [Acidimicrobiia bacterium]|nr:LacI family DNA-binding transcriptional regulator [Acidimicrobiia bacterium]